MNETFAFFHALSTGEVRKIKSKKVQCWDCNGRGREQCAACQGVGSTVEKCIVCDGCKRTLCQACSGNAPKCKRCNGTKKRRLPTRPAIHPADTWTLHSVSSLSVNGSFT